MFDLGHLVAWNVATKLDDGSIEESTLIGEIIGMTKYAYYIETMDGPKVPVRRHRCRKPTLIDYQKAIRSQIKWNRCKDEWKHE